MSATSRLWNILRAQVTERLDSGWPDPPPWEKFREEFRDYVDSHQEGGSRHNDGSGSRYSGSTGSTGSTDYESRATGQDPELARYYANLEVPYGSDLDTIEKAWKRLMRQYHPDRHATDPERQRIANELTGQLNHAFGELRSRLEKNGKST